MPEICLQVVETSISVEQEFATDQIVVVQSSLFREL